MKKLLLYLLFLFPVISEAQTSVYHPFPDSAAAWRVDYGDYEASSCWNRSYFLGSPYIIAGITYNDVYYTECPGSINWSTHICSAFCIPDTSSGGSYIGTMWQDTALRQVYFAGDTNTNYLLYNFSLNVGDTIPTGVNNSSTQTITVIGIDSILIDGTYRKQFVLSDSQRLIEGIGSTTGLIEDIYVFEVGGNLDCFSQNGRTLYPDTNSICSFTTAVKKIPSLNTLFRISPNPAHDILNVEYKIPNVSTDSPKAELKIYDVMGREVMKEKINSQLSTFNFQLPPGVYLIKMSDGEKMAIQKLIVQ